VNGQTDFIFAEWTPTGHGLIFVFQNNIFYKSNPTVEPVQITFDGDRSTYNGVPDWVYEEEIFSSNKANWVSPDGTKLVYIRFDDTPTVLMNIPVYGPPGNLDYQYTRQFGIHYPKAGTPNPTVKLFYVDLAAIEPGVQPVRQEILAPTELPSPADQIISSVSFANNSTLIAVWMNRVQNHAYVQACQAITCRTVS
jgi:dipeptidyl-peptidase 4